MNSGDSTEKTVRANKFNKVAEHKLMYENHLCSINKQWTIQKGKKKLSRITSKRIEYLEKNEQKQGIKVVYAENYFDERN